MAVMPDKYELPLMIYDSVAEMAQDLGVLKNTLLKCIQKDISTTKLPYGLSVKIVRVYLDGGEADT